MNVKSKFDTEDDAVREPKKQYYWFGYGNPNQLGGDGRGRLMGGIWDSKTFDGIFEKLGLKKKTRKRSEGDE
jgi:hypothetical protein